MCWAGLGLYSVGRGERGGVAINSRVAGGSRPHISIYSRMITVLGVISCLVSNGSFYSSSLAPTHSQANVFSAWLVE